MLIHSVTPAYYLTPQPELPETVCRQMGGTYLEGIDTPEGFCLSRIHSTDPAAYLNGAFTPGSICKL